MLLKQCAFITLQKSRITKKISGNFLENCFKKFLFTKTIKSLY